MKRLLITLTALLLLAFTADEENNLQQKAKEEKKNIAVYFCGSDWCSNCYRFKSELLQTQTIDSLLHQHFVFYMADFPQRKKLDKETAATNDFLAGKLNPGGEFPVLVIADSSWNVKTKIYLGSNREAVIEKLKQVQH